MTDDDTMFFENTIISRRIKDAQVSMKSLLILREEQQKSQVMLSCEENMQVAIELTEALIVTLKEIQNKLKG